MHSCRKQGTVYSCTRAYKHTKANCSTLGQLYQQSTYRQHAVSELKAMKSSLLALVVFVASMTIGESFAVESKTMRAKTAVSALKPPMSTAEMMSQEGETAKVYANNVQTTYG
jgi:hypothetical protein